MTYPPKLNRLFCLFLVLPFALAGCSDEDSSNDETNLTGQTTVEKAKTRSTQDATENESRYSQAIKAAGVAPGDYKSNYKLAMKALEKEDYEKARELLTGAVAANNIEELKLRFTSMNFGTYLPHYHLGMIAFLNYDCVVAMQEWETSLRQGVIQKTPEYRFLQDAMLECKSEGA